LRAPLAVSATPRVWVSVEAKVIENTWLPASAAALAVSGP
jgi:hypothetical protein